MFHTQFITGPRLDGGAFPIKVIDLELDKVNLRVFLENFGQQLRIVMEREADVADAAFGLLAGEEAPTVHAVNDLDALMVKGMQPIVVKILDTTTLQLLVENAFQIGHLIDGPHGHLAGDGERLTRITFHDNLSKGFFTLASMIGIGGVKIGETALDEPVGHLLKLLDVDARLVIGVDQRQTHESKSKLFHNYFF